MDAGSKLNYCELLRIHFRLHGGHKDDKCSEKNGWHFLLQAANPFRSSPYMSLIWPVMLASLNLDFLAGKHHQSL
jgi:hypothetical protein